MSVAINSQRRATFGKQLLLWIVVTIVLLAYGEWLFPESVAGSGWSAFFASIGALLIYGAVSEGARRASSDTTRVALVTGARVGWFLGLLEAMHHIAEDFGDLRPPMPAILGVSMWGLLFLCFGIAGSTAYRKTGSLFLSMVASVWSAVVSTVALVSFAFAAGLLFMPHMQHMSAGEFAASGMSDPRAFVVRNMFDAASSHLLIAPVVAAIVGVSSALASSRLRLVGLRTQALFGCVCLLLLTAGIMAIRFASSLDRAARPPFIMCGLLALGISLASAYPIVSAIRQR